MKCPRVSESNRRRARHRMSKTRIHQTWLDMWQRTWNPKNPRFWDYGGRGITVCDRWRSFENFLADMGPKPPGMSLGRIDNDGDYTPENCRWETRSQQQRNRRGNRIICWKGERKTVTEWAEVLKININAFRGRIRKWPIEKVMTYEYKPRT